ncbi:hypothetical protein HDU93_001285 [Gonapodya sp. JEL0774]|nr:hypothetical protein HDU93_001285 [Gonapodya sp. JEL0774]
MSSLFLPIYSKRLLANANSLLAPLSSHVTANVNFLRLVAISASVIVLLLASSYWITSRQLPIDAINLKYEENPAWTDTIAQYAHVVQSKTKFIVVTSINPPTHTMRTLCHLPDWQGVVIGDSKSPQNWSEGTCIFLSLERQQQLPYSVVSLIPEKAYTRKNIGYLFAIHLGAQIIFDTDDDNLPVGPVWEFSSLKDADDKSYTVYNLEGGTILNPYSHFGRADIWPRGYPLEEINSTNLMGYVPNVGSDRTRIAGRTLILQGLANLDPDVDAVFRLVRGEDSLPNVHFCNDTPPIRLAPGSLAPFNSQNTLFDYDAFWALLLPVTVSFRTCDIWRGYYMQRLLWDVGGALTFRGATVDQIRNAHNYLDDFFEESQIYNQAGPITRFLASWKSNEKTLQSKFRMMFSDLNKHQFLGEEDVKLAIAWLRDLERIG